ncbi:MAG: 3-hydroxyisobutyrate dehydrogenase [Myxococcales bacterium]|nr:3-hydroxyisobutyrate dehydrogenase [Myxococcales bacterium]
MTQVAFIGLGAMGVRMAARLVEAGYPVTVTNRTAARAEPLVANGARWAESPAAAAAEAELVISMVTDVAASRAVWCDPERGALARLREGAIAIEASTLTPGWIDELAAAAGDAGARFLAAPVVGTRPHAESGRLTWLVGGDVATLAEAHPALQVMGGSIHHVGEVTQGAVMKLAVNALFGVQVAALAEILGVLSRAGVAVEDAVAVLEQMAISSPAAKVVGAAIAARQYAPMFPIELVEKDFGYVVAAAEALGAEVPAAAAARAVYRRACEAGYGEHNINGVAQLFE